MSPWPIEGDFNEILSNDEKFGGQVLVEGDIYAFRRTIDGCCLLDIGYRGPICTWINRGPRATFFKEHLDRVFCNLA